MRYNFFHPISDFYEYCNSHLFNCKPYPMMFFIWKHFLNQGYVCLYLLLLVYISLECSIQVLGLSVVLIILIFDRHTEVIICLKMFPFQFDIILRNQVPMYDYYRKMGGLGQARVILVQEGSFKELRNYILQTSTASALQFKMPRKLRKKEWVELLLKNTP